MNGFGRIGRNYVRCLLDHNLLGRDAHLVGINDLWEPGTLAHLLAYDSTFGRLRWSAAHDQQALTVDGHPHPGVP